MSYLNEFTKSLDEYRFQPEGGRAVWFLIDYILINQYITENNDWPMGDVYVASNSTEHNAKWYRIHCEQSRYEKELKKFIDEPRTSAQLLEYLELHRDQTVEILKKANYGKMSNQELKNFFHTVLANYYQVLRPSSIIRLVDLGIINRLSLVFADKIFPTNALSIASANQKRSHAILEKISMLSLADSIINNKYDIDSDQVTLKLSEIREKYCYSELGYYNEMPKSENDFRKQLQQLLQSSPADELAKIINEEKNINKERENLLQKIGEKDRLIAELASELSSIKDEYKLSMNQVLYHSADLFAEIASRTNRSLANIMDLSPEEISMLLDGETIDEDLVAERLRKRTLIAFEKRLYILTGTASIKFQEK